MADIDRMKTGADTVHQGAHAAAPQSELDSKASDKAKRVK